jgi:hypothetical protein
MPKTIAQRTQAVQEILDRTAGEPESVKLEALKAAVPSPSGADVDWLWKALIGGLMVLGAAALGGALWAGLDGNDKTDANTALIAFTPLLTGLLALFVPSPMQRSD